MSQKQANETNRNIYVTYIVLCVYVFFLSLHRYNNQQYKSKPKYMRYFFLIITFSLSLIVNGQTNNNWSCSWGTSPEYTSKKDMPNANLSNKTLRQIIHVSTGGDSIRLSLSNIYGSSTVYIRSIYVANLIDNYNIDISSARYITFSGNKNIKISAGKNIISDAILFPLQKLQRLAVTICYGNQTPSHATSHRGSRTTSYIANGEIRPQDYFFPIERLDHWYNILSVTVNSKKPVIAILGNSITDGRGSTTNAQNRWPDRMAEYLTKPAGVVNLGIGGNCVLQGGISKPLIKRYKKELSFHKGITHLIIYEGTNDIGTCKTEPSILAKKLISAYKEMIEYSHKHGIRVYMATITPTKGSSHYSKEHEKARQEVNTWIRSGKEFDGIIDFDQLVRDPSDNEKIQEKLNDDWLHLNPEGYRVMGQYAANIMSKQFKADHSK